MPLPSPDSEDGWSVVAPAILDILAAFLKNKRRWKAHAPVLRELNSRWRLLVNQHVYSVQPHVSRKMTSEDAASLLKFPNLTSVDMSRFMLPDINDATSTSEESVSQWNRVACVLSELPHLSHVTMRTSAAGNLFTKQDFSRCLLLSRVKSLHIIAYGYRPSERSGVAPFVRGMFPNLKTLQLDGYWNACVDDLAQLEHLDSLQLFGMVDRRQTHKFRGQKCLTGLGPWKFINGDEQILCGLKNLQELRLIVNSQSDLDCITASGISDRLSVFSLTCFFSGVHVDKGFFKECTQLRDLSLNGVSLFLNSIADLTGLTNLTLKEVQLHRDLSPGSNLCEFYLPPGLDKLKALSVVDLEDSTWTQLKLRLTRGLQGLTSLSLSGGHLDAVTVEAIGYLFHLENLTLSSGHDSTVERLNRLERISNLRVLCLKNVALTEAWKPPSLDFLSRLHKLLLGCGAYGEWQTPLQQLRSRSPCMIIDTSI